MWVMGYWLLKTEPGTYCWDDLVREKRATWDGITNALALINLRKARTGDEALIYHTGSERRAVGVARIVKGPYPDPKKNDPRLVVVDIAPTGLLKTPVSLDRIKSDPVFEGWDLLRLGRLSFVPVPAPIWRRIMKLADEL